VSAIKAANLAFRFMLELCALAAVASWGSQVSDSTAVNIIVAVAAPLAMAAFWGALLAPSSKRRLEPPLRTLAELFVLALAVAALVEVDAPVLAAILAAAAFINGLLLHVWRQDAADLSRARA
jgi:Kef-type K+ transport system membrane component KefB